MEKLTRADLFSLEEYSEKRAEFRAEVLAHKQNRHVRIGEHLALYFEDRLTMHYQIQEMLRIEKIFEADGIQEELDAYNPLIPDGTNFKATMMIEYDDVEERKQALTQLVGIEDQVWVQVEGHDKSFAISDEDLERTEDGKTSAVHFSRFELDAGMVESLKNGAGLNMGSDLANYAQVVTPVSASIRESLTADLS